MATKQLTSQQRVQGVGCLLGIVLIIVCSISSCFIGGDESSEAGDAREDGFHCLSRWDGNHDGLEKLVRGQLTDPGSMETYETRISKNVSGTHYIQMDFGARNSFGGMVRHTAFGEVDSQTCNAVLTDIQ